MQMQMQRRFASRHVIVTRLYHYPQCSSWTMHTAAVSSRSAAGATQHARHLQHVPTLQRPTAVHVTLRSPATCLAKVPHHQRVRHVLLRQPESPQYRGRVPSQGICRTVHALSLPCSPPLRLAPLPLAQRGGGVHRPAAGILPAVVVAVGVGELHEVGIGGAGCQRETPLPRPQGCAGGRRSAAEFFCGSESSAVSV